MIRRAENAMRTKWANTSNAFKWRMFLKKFHIVKLRERIGESSRARDLLQTHLVEAGREATRLRRRIRELKSNLQDKLAPVKVSLQMDRASEEKEISGDSDST